MTGLLELADRCEQATGPDHELDRDINYALFGKGVMRWLIRVFPWTASLDAAMTLVPEGWRPNIDMASEEGAALVDLWSLPIASPKPSRRHAKAATPALALCAAALRARATQGEGP